MERNLDHVDLEFRDFVKIDEGDSGFPQDYDSRHPMPQFCEATDDIAKFFQAGQEEQELQKLNRSRMEPTRTAPQENKPEPQSVEEFFTCEKRSSAAGKLRVTKRFIPETSEVMLEYWDHEGQCIGTTFITAGDEISEGSPLAKASISDSMLKTLAGLRSVLLPEEFAAAEKAVKALDVDLFLQICRRAQAAA